MDFPITGSTPAAPIHSPPSRQQSGLRGLTAVRGESPTSGASAPAAKSRSPFKRFRKFLSRVFSPNTTASHHPASPKNPTHPKESQTFRLPNNPKQYYIPGFEPASLSENQFAFNAELPFGRVKEWTPEELLPVSRPPSPKAQAEVSPDHSPKRPRLSYDFKTFSILYGTTIGARVINAFLRNEIQKEDFEHAVEDAFEEMSARMGTEYLSLLKQRPQIKAEMRALPAMLPDIAEEIHDRAKPAAMASEIFRGQGMTPQGIKTLKKLFKEGTPIQAGNFVSCSTSPAVAHHFSDNYAAGAATPNGTKAATRVIFKIIAHSQSALTSPTGYSESEVILPPGTKFHITAMKYEVINGEKTGRIIIGLKETSRAADAVALPR